MEFLGAEVEDVDAIFEEERRRLSDIFTSLIDVVAGLDPEFYPKGALDQIHGGFSDQLIEQLRSYSTKPNVSHLKAANDIATLHTTLIFSLASMSRPPESQKIITSARKTFGSFAASIEEKANEADEHYVKQVALLDANGVKIEKLDAELEALSTATREKLSEWQEEFTKKQTEWAKEHSGAEINRLKESSTALIKQQDLFDKTRVEVVEEQTDLFDDAFLKFTVAVGRAKVDIQEKQDTIRKLHDLVTDETVAGGYHKGAKDEKIEANRWRNRSLFCLGIAVIWLGFKYVTGFVTTNDVSINWPEVLTVSSLTAILLYAAGYTSRQSTMHRNNEKSLRSYALETQALDPFIASLKTAEQQAIKAELVRRMFGQQNAQSSIKSLPLSDETMKTFGDQISEIVKDALKKVADKT